MRHLRRELGLRSDCDPVFRDKFSPDLVLALFSRQMAQPQRDWPSQTVQPGFVYYDSEKQNQALAEFLASGDPPIVFTLGSTAVPHPEISMNRACKRQNNSAGGAAKSPLPSIPPRSLLPNNSTHKGHLQPTKTRSFDPEFTLLGNGTLFEQQRMLGNADTR